MGFYRDGFPSRPHSPPLQPRNEPRRSTPKEGGQLVFGASCGAVAWLWLGHSAATNRSNLASFEYGGLAPSAPPLAPVDSDPRRHSFLRDFCARRAIWAGDCGRLRGDQLVISQHVGKQEAKIFFPLRVRVCKAGGFSTRGFLGVGFSPARTILSRRVGQYGFCEARRWPWGISPGGRDSRRVRSVRGRVGSQSGDIGGSPAGSAGLLGVSSGQCTAGRFRVCLCSLCTDDAARGRGGCAGRGSERRPFASLLRPRG